jgi:hypothetical protein
MLLVGKKYISQDFEINIFLTLSGERSNFFLLWREILTYVWVLFASKIHFNVIFSCNLGRYNISAI